MKNKKHLDSVWALIPARSGSKSIKHKNLQKISGISLLGRSIIAAKKSRLIQRTFLSTDSKKFASEGLKYKAEIPFLRSKKNANDNATDFDVVKEFLIKIKKKEKQIPKYIIYLRPTTPIRNPKVIDKAIKIMKNLKNYDSLVSVHCMKEPVFKKFFIKKKKLIPISKTISLDKANGPRQNFVKSYTANGYLDIVKTNNILNKNKYLNKTCYPFQVQRAIDIDSIFDLKLAEISLKKKLFN